MRTDVGTLWNLAEPYARAAGLDLIEVQWGRETAGWVLRVYVDRAEGVTGAPAVGFDDCERVSRDLSAALDAADSIGHPYSLEVSSPGLDRPLRRERDFARFAGHRARIRCANGVGGRRNFHGLLRGAGEGRVDIECDGHRFGIAVADIVRANLVPDWDAEFAAAKHKERSAS